MCSNNFACINSGDFSKELTEINRSIQDIKSDTKKILDNQNTIIKLQGNFVIPLKALVAPVLA
jgi:hypothetical protein